MFGTHAGASFRTAPVQSGASVRSPPSPSRGPCKTRTRRPPSSTRSARCRRWGAATVGGGARRGTRRWRAGRSGPRRPEMIRTGCSMSARRRRKVRELVGVAARVAHPLDELVRSRSTPEVVPDLRRGRTRDRVEGRADDPRAGPAPGSGRGRGRVARSARGPDSWIGTAGRPAARRRRRWRSGPPGGGGEQSGGRRRCLGRRGDLPSPASSAVPAPGARPIARGDMTSLVSRDHSGARQVDGDHVEVPREGVQTGAKA